MNVYDLIEKKRWKKPLTKEEINWLVLSFVDGKIANEEMASFLMAVVLNGMNHEETYNLTKSMQATGKTLSFDEFVVDKHSTGGVSDSTTLLLVPILASLGVKIGKMSGRSLGFTGGTADKLEVFPGIDLSLDEKKFKGIVDKIGCALITQTADIAVADKKIYALRDKTATVESIPLIASSIMSKKLSCGAKLLLLNVHFGTGAFMKTKKSAIELAKTMVEIGKKDGLQCLALVSNMDMPLAKGVGCVQEISSVIDAFDGEKSRLRELSIALAVLIVSRVLRLSKKVSRSKIENVLSNGDAIRKFKEMIEMQGGDAAGLFDKTKLPQSAQKISITSRESGYVSKIDALACAKVVANLKRSSPNPQTEGLRVLVEIGQKVDKGQQIAELFVSSKAASIDEVYNAIIISQKKAKPPKLVCKIIE